MAVWVLINRKENVRVKTLLKLTATMLLLANLSTAMADISDNQVTILNAGYAIPDKENELDAKVGSTISLVQAPGVTLIADPGMTTPEDWNTVLARLADKGVEPKDVTHIFISHHHPDHTTKLGLFPNATVVDFQASYKHDVWQGHGDHYELAPGVTVLHTPGHTHEDASLIVETDEGVYALTHLWWTPGFQPETDPLAEDHNTLDESRKAIINKVDWIIPGHGEMFRNTMKIENGS